MKVSSILAFASGAGLCVALYACGGSDHPNAVTVTPSQPSQPQVVMLSVTDVLAKAKVQSETDDPFSVIGGSVTPVDDETSDPISVD